MQSHATDTAPCYDYLLQHVASIMHHVEDVATVATYYTMCLCYIMIVLVNISYRLCVRVSRGSSITGGILYI